MSATRWESRVDSVKAIRFQLSDIREALLELAETDGDIKSHSEADTLSTKKLVILGFWYQLSFVEEDFKVNYFLSVVDQAIASPESRFEQYNEYKKLFGFLFPKKLKELEDTDLMSCCVLLQDALRYGEASAIDAKELNMELKLMDTYLPDEIITPIDALKFLKKADHYPNALVAYRVLLTIPVTVASAERNFQN
ncbi:uncharacterized protein LOC143598173 [Bidens hawaiensis]|uniref:uncharacterized protein LOC143598173 n=1 Tax=Bidens hawaiensis TaxID=980011 RepID=UPI00404A0628